MRGKGSLEQREKEKEGEGGERCKREKGARI